MTRRGMLQAGAAFCGARLASAQDQPTFSTEVKVVNVLATVRNKTGTLKTPARKPSAISSTRATCR